MPGTASANYTYGGDTLSFTYGSSVRLATNAGNYTASAPYPPLLVLELYYYGQPQFELVH